MLMSSSSSTGALQILVTSGSPKYSPPVSSLLGNFLTLEIRLSRSKFSIHLLLGHHANLFGHILHTCPSQQNVLIFTNRTTSLFSSTLSTSTFLGVLYPTTSLIRVSEVCTLVVRVSSFDFIGFKVGIVRSVSSNSPLVDFFRYFVSLI